LIIPVLKGAAYCLFHAPGLLMSMGTTQRLERLKNPGSEYLKQIPTRLRDFNEVVKYTPNQVFTGNLWPDDMKGLNRPWYDNPLAGASAQGRFGDIIPEDFLIGAIKFADGFDLVHLHVEFQERVRNNLMATGLFSEEELRRWKEGDGDEKFKRYIDREGAEPLKYKGEVVGCVRRAHELDEVLNAKVMLENLACKATSIWTVRRLLKNTGVNVEDVEYIIEASEEACGDMNQRGGGNFAKAVGEMCGLLNATGSDIRSFCSGPLHAIVTAAALVQAGIYKNVIVTGGGSVAKLGMNGRDHVKKGLPLLEDVLGAFAILVGEDDGVNPVIRTDIIGSHKIGSGASPQAVMEALVVKPLSRAGYKITDIDKYAPELQNPEITEPAGAGDVPRSNYKMIGALAIMKNEIQRHKLDNFINRYGMPGFAPTQGHVPSGVPFAGFAREGILAGKYRRVMLIGKGSLFLGRMTGLFDGVSIVLEANKNGREREDIDTRDIRYLLADILRRVARELQAQ